MQGSRESSVRTALAAWVARDGGVGGALDGRACSMRRGLRAGGGCERSEERRVGKEC